MRSLTIRTALCASSIRTVAPQVLKNTRTITAATKKVGISF